MKSLEMYKELSQEDKKNLTTYCIYDSIYTVAQNENYKISDDEVERIKNLSHYLYLKDEYYNLSPARISDYITIGCIEHEIPLEKYEDMNWNDILELVDNDNYDFYKDEMER